MRVNYFIGNWKMNLDLEQAKDLSLGLHTELADFAKVENIKILLAPPFLFIPSLQKLLEKSFIQLAAQNCHQEKYGAFTGEVSAPMLRSTSCRYCILGHSERRLLFNESDSLVAQKVKAVLDESLIPVLCVGETAAEREKKQYFDRIRAQLSAVYKILTADERLKMVVAYEPVWAIGTGQTATPEQAEEIHLFIRNYLRSDYGEDLALGTPLLYGGSVKPGNARDLFVKKNIDGFLVGGASLKLTDFHAIINAALLE